jgi:PAS domain S-box-containing protein
MSQEPLDQINPTELPEQGGVDLPAGVSDISDIEPHMLRQLVQQYKTQQIELKLVNEEMQRLKHERELAWQKYSEFYDTAPTGYFTLDENAVILETNQTAARMLGMDRADLLNRPMTSLVAPRDLIDLQRLQQDMTSGLSEVRRVRLTMIKRDGSKLHTLIEGRRKDDNAGKRQSAYYHIVFSDITELTETERAYNTVVENSLQGIAVLQDGRIVLVNPTLTQITGYSKAELLALSLTELATAIVPEDRSSVVNNLTADEFLPKLETRFIHKSGQVRWLESYATPIEYRGQPALQVSFIDITERKLAEIALRKSEEIHRVTISSISDAVFITDEAGRFTYICSNLDNIFGYSGAEVEKMEDITKLLGATIFDPADLDATGEIENIEHQITDKAGNLHTLLVNVKRVSIQGGTTLFTCRDITDRKQAELDLAQVLGTVREQREQLRALTGQLTETQENERKALARELHDQVGQQLTSLNLTLNTLRAHCQAQPSPPRPVISLVDFSLQMVEETTERIQDVLANLRPPVLDDYGLVAALHWYAVRLGNQVDFALQVRGQEPSPRLPASVELALFRVAQEALNNAIKHSQASRVTIQVETNHAVWLKITDDGIGFDDKAQSQSVQRGGWGLLTIKERVEAIGGSYCVKSEPGRGTQIIVEVPR